MTERILVPDKVKVRIALNAAKREGFSDISEKEKKISNAIRCFNELGPEELIVRGLVASKKE